MKKLITNLAKQIKTLNDEAMEMKKICAKNVADYLELSQINNHHVEQIIDLKAEVRKLRKSLKLYADEGNWKFINFQEVGPQIAIDALREE